jgi:hypothetical protein
MLKEALYKNINARMALPTAGEPYPIASTCFSNVDSRAVQTMKHTNIHAVDVRNMVRRLNLLTRRENPREVARFHIVSIPLIRVWVSWEVMPIESRIKVK